MTKFLEWFEGGTKIIFICAGIVVGAILGLLVPGQQWIGIFGDVFVGALKAVAPILVFFLVAGALTNQTGSIGSRFRTVIVLYMVTTLLAAVVAVVASYVFPVSITLVNDAAENSPPSGLYEVFRALFTNMVRNPIESITTGNYIGILLWSVIFGWCLKRHSSDNTKTIMADISEAISRTVRFVICFAPLGIMGLVFSAVSTSGLSIFTDYGKIVLLLVGCMAFTSLVLNPILASILLRRNAYPLLFRCLKESGIYAFFTRSSAANIPMNMRLCRKLGIDEEFYSVSIPLGSTINMDGAAITITVLSLALCTTLGISVHPAQAFLLSVVATLGACGASGVPGGSLLLIPMAASLFGINNDYAMMAVAVGFIIGVIQDSVETCLNSSGDAMFTAVAEYHDRRKAGVPMNFMGEFAKKAE